MAPRPAARTQAERIASAVSSAVPTAADYAALLEAHAALIDTGGFFLLDPLLHPLTAPALLAADGVRADPKAAAVSIAKVTSARFRAIWGATLVSDGRNCIVMATTQARAEFLCEALRDTERLELPDDLTPAEQRLWGAFLVGADDASANKKRASGRWLLERVGGPGANLARAARVISPDGVATDARVFESVSAKQVRTAAAAVLAPSHAEDDADRSEPSGMAKRKRISASEAALVGTKVAEALVEFLAAAAVERMETKI